MPFNLFNEKADQQKNCFRSKCREEILALADRETPVSLEEFKAIERMNSYEHTALIYNASEELILDITERFLQHCSYEPLQEFQLARNYDEAVLAVLLPKILKFKK